LFVDDNVFTDVLSVSNIRASGPAPRNRARFSARHPGSSHFLARYRDDERRRFEGSGL